MSYLRFAVAGFAIGLIVGVASDCQAQELNGLSAKDAIAKSDLGPGQVLFKFNKPGSCRIAGEFAVALTDVKTQRVIFGCAHSWGEVDFMSFQDGDIGAIGQGKWVLIGKVL
jgi:hypothetical protein